MKKRNLLHLIVLLLIALPILYAGVIYPRLPETIPVHFGLDGKPDRYGNKSEIFIVVGLLAFISLGLHLLLINVHKIDPKKSAKLSQSIMERISLAVVLFMSVLSAFTVQSAYSTNLLLDRLLLPLVGLLFAYLGNLMYSIKPNYFAGFRTPWALENEDNWRKTHQLAGKLWFGGGVLIAIITFFVPLLWGIILLLLITVVLCAIPFVYSFRQFRKSSVRHN